MVRSRRHGLLLLLVVIAAGSVAVSASAKSRFVRVRRDFRARPLALDTAIVSYAGLAADGSGLRVDLVAAVHIADLGYYRELNRRFDAYDAVLYELIAESGVCDMATRDPGGNPLSALQGGLQAALELEHQLDAIAYQRPSFVHADLTPDEFAASMREGGESVVELLLRALEAGSSQAAALPGIPTNTQLVTALMAPDQPLALKRLLAPILGHMDELVAAIEGETGTTLIARRNQRALKVLSREVARGRRRVAIFYGAAHLADLESRLHADFGLTRSGVSWLTAWDLSVRRE